MVKGNIRRLWEEYSNRYDLGENVNFSGQWLPYRGVHDWVQILKLFYNILF